MLPHDRTHAVGGDLRCATILEARDLPMPSLRHARQLGRAGQIAGDTLGEDESLE
jgi:hypothetical protein